MVALATVVALASAGTSTRTFQIQNNCGKDAWVTVGGFKIAVLIAVPVQTAHWQWKFMTPYLGWLRNFAPM